MTTPDYRDFVRNPGLSRDFTIWLRKFLDNDRPGWLPKGKGGGVTKITSSDLTVTITHPSGPVVDLSAPGGGGGSGMRQFFVDTPDASGNATAGITGGFSNFRRLLPYLSHSGDGYWTAMLRIPDNYASGGAVVLTGVANATSGAVRLIVGTAVVAAGSSEDPTLTDETAQNITVPGTALLRFDTTFTLSTTPVANRDLLVRIKRNAASGSDTCTASYGIWAAVFTYTSS